MRKSEEAKGRVSEEEQGAPRFRSYQDLKLWQAAMEVAEACYRATNGFPREELFVTVSQIRRASISIPANVAEGWGREGTREFIQYLRIAQGSIKELETLVLFSIRVELMGSETGEKLLENLAEVSRMARALISSLQRKLKKDG